MGFAEVLIALLSFFAGTTQHVASTCVNAPVAIHVTQNSGLETSPTLRWALLGVPPAC